MVGLFSFSLISSLLCSVILLRQLDTPRAMEFKKSIKNEGVVNLVCGVNLFKLKTAHNMALKHTFKGRACLWLYHSPE